MQLWFVVQMSLIYTRMLCAASIRIATQVLLAILTSGPDTASVKVGFMRYVYVDAPISICALSNLVMMKISPI